MTIFQTTQIYASELELTYDQEKQLYIGKFISATGVFNIDGPNRAEVMYEMDRLLAEEYRLMQQEAARKESYRERVEGRSRGGGGRSIGGEKVHRIDASEAKRLRDNPSALSKAGSWVDVITGGLALSTGNWLEAGAAAASLALGDFFEGVESLWDKSPEAKVFAVSFGGVLITAGSRRQLRRKLVRQRQKRLHIIMSHIRKKGLVKDSIENVTEKLKRENNKIRQLRKKKERAMVLGPDKWKSTVSPQGQQKDWRARVVDLRERVKGKKARSEELWQERVGTRAQRAS